MKLNPLAMVLWGAVGMIAFACGESPKEIAAWVGGTMLFSWAISLFDRK